MTATTAISTPSRENRDVYTAWFNAEGLTLIHDRYAGISGPMQSAPADELADLAAAEAWIARQGFRLVTGWTVGQDYTGLLLRAEIARTD